MKCCTECGAIEQDSHENEEGAEVCDVCGMEESIKHYDEDYGKDR